MANKTQVIEETNKHSCNDSCCSESSAALIEPEAISSCSCCPPEDSPLMLI